MKMFGNLTTDGLEQSGDRLGGGGTLESGVHSGKVKLAYAGKAQSSSAQSITILVDVGGFEYRETLWITNRNGENFYTDKKDATKKHPLPGYVSIDEFCMLTTGLPLSEQPIEEKVVSLYDFDAKKDVPQNVPVLVDVLGKEISMGVLKQIVDKQQKDASGTYVNSGETREENVVDKFFHMESGRTVTEFKTGSNDAVFRDKWATKNTGKTRNRVKRGEGKSGVPGRSAPAKSRGPTKSLFAS